MKHPLDYDPNAAGAPHPLPADAKSRKATPLATFLLTYFPFAFIDLARCFYIANEQHNPGEPMHWARDKSTNHLDCLLRHMMEHGEVPQRHRQGERISPTRTAVRGA